MTSLQNLLVVLPHFIIPKLPPLAIRSLLLTSKNLYTALSPFMETVYQTHFPGEPMYPKATKNDSYWTRRFLARTGASQVYVWGRREGNILCLSDPVRGNHNIKTVSSPMRSEMLSRLGVKKIVTRRWFLEVIVALSMDGKVYITTDKSARDDDTSDDDMSDDDTMPPARLFECECPNEFIVDVAVSYTSIFALSDTGRLYIWCQSFSDKPPTMPPYKFVQVDLQSALGLPDTPRISTITGGTCYFACLVENVGVVMLRAPTFRGGLVKVIVPPSREEKYVPDALIVPRVSNSLEPEWDVVDMKLGYWYVELEPDWLLLVLANGHVYRVMVEKMDVISVCAPKPLKFPEPIDRIWVEEDRIAALSRGKSVFYDEFTIRTGNSWEEYLQRRNQKKKFDAADTCTMALGNSFNLDLKDDGTLYVWDVSTRNSAVLGLGVDDFYKHLIYDSDDSGHDNPYLDSDLEKDFYFDDFLRVLESLRPLKINLEHVVCVSESKYYSAAIVVDPKDVSRLMLKP